LFSFSLLVFAVAVLDVLAVDDDDDEDDDVDASDGADVFCILFVF
jgi:hypothetical protein